MTNYIIYFNQQWVPDQTEEWFQARGPLANEVVEDMKAAGVLVFAGGLVEEIEEAIGFNDAGQELPPISQGEFVGGLTIVNVETESEAKDWGARIAIACGWPQEVRAFKD